jgi:hypothetical protein
MFGHHRLFVPRMDWATGRKEKKDGDSTFEPSTIMNHCGCKVMLGIRGVIALHGG